MTAEKVLYESADTRVTGADGVIRLEYHCREAAGAIGRRQGESLLQALAAIEATECHTLLVAANSAGAHFGEPMQGLDAIDRIIGKLWALKTRGARLVFYSDGWLYGGMALTAAACADEIVLGPRARMGLFGQRVSGQAAAIILPPEGFQPPGVLFRRKTGNEPGFWEAWTDGAP